MAKTFDIHTHLPPLPAVQVDAKIYASGDSPRPKFLYISLLSTTVMHSHVTMCTAKTTSFASVVRTEILADFGTGEQSFTVLHSSPRTLILHTALHRRVSVSAIPMISGKTCRTPKKRIPTGFRIPSFRSGVG